MISYFIEGSPGSLVVKSFPSYVWGLLKIIELHMNKKSYSKDVDALLVEYLYESMFIPFPKIICIFYRKSENMTIVSVNA